MIPARVASETETTARSTRRGVMKSENAVRGAAMGALVAAVLMVGAAQAGAGPHRAPVDGPSRLPLGRAKMVVEDGSGGAFARLKQMLARVRILRDVGWEGIGIQRLPATVGRDQ
jgi:hypothetical protein